MMRQLEGAKQQAESSPPITLPERDCACATQLSDEEYTLEGERALW